MATYASDAPLVWIDCEVWNMTGLDPDTNSILSISCFVTDYQLEILDDDGWEAIIHHPPSTLEAMNAWCTETHGASGLTAAVLASRTTADAAAADLLAYVKRFVPRPGAALLAGNSIHADKAFLAKPPFDELLRHLHYRLFDVSSIKEAARRWAPAEVLARAPMKKGLHDAREDILESIDEARFYKETFFRTV
ncbi:MAG: hypothetical protein M1826_004035 [Phylliscum demangeonii]|nr:MAG: hypothetical protein M1826_004035 [Phylliscum demangeonii]